MIDRQHSRPRALVLGALTLIAHAGFTAPAQDRASIATVPTSQPISRGGLVRSVITIDLYDYANDEGIIESAEVQKAIAGYSSVVLIVPTCDWVEENDGNRRPAAPVMRGGLRIRYADGFRRFWMKSDSNQGRLGVAGPTGFFFEGVAPLIENVEITGVDWGQGVASPVVDLCRDRLGPDGKLGTPDDDASCNRPLILNSTIQTEGGKDGIAIRNSGQELAGYYYSRFRSDNGIAVLFDTDVAGPRSTMSGWVIWGCELQSYGTGRPLEGHGAVTNGFVGGGTWVGTNGSPGNGVQRDAARFMLGQNKVVSAGIPRSIWIDFTCEGSAQRVTQWNLGADNVKLAPDSFNAGWPRELNLIGAPPASPN